METDKEPLGDGDSLVELISVEVAYALPEKQRIIALEVPKGSTAFEAVIKSGITREFPSIDVENDAMGIFSVLMDGKNLPLPKEYKLEMKDRVEIYRPLIIDPKQARLDRAEKGKGKKQKDKEGNS